MVSLKTEVYFFRKFKRSVVFPSVTSVIYTPSDKPSTLIDFEYKVVRTFCPAAL